MIDKRWNEDPVAPELGFDNYSLPVSRATFITDPAYVEGKIILLALHGRSPDLPPEYAVREERIPVGKTDQIKIDPDNPGRIVQVTGEPIQNFPARSLYSIFIKRAMTEFGMLDELSKGGLWFDQAAIWEGHSFQMQKELFEWPSGKGKEPIKTERRMPKKYLGKSVIEENLAANNGTTSVALDSQLRALYDQAADYGMFVTLAESLPAVKNNAEILAAVKNPAEAEKRWGGAEEVTA